MALLLASVGVYAADPLWNGRGRIVISSDGNAHDEDDWGASALMLALLASQGMQEALPVYVYCDHIWEGRSDRKGYDGRAEMIESIEGGRDRFGFPDTEFICAYDDPERAYEAVARLLTFYEMSKPKKKGIDPLAYIAPTAQIGEDCYVAPFAYIGEHVKIGKGTQIYPHTTVYDNATIGEGCVLYANVSVYHDCKIGNRVTLHSGCVIGADGFGFAPTENGYEKIPQIGIVTIEDDVEIGANACVDRSTMGSTVVRKGVKIDNLVQIAHNVEVGENTVMSAQVGVAGSTKIGQWCMFGGQVGIAGHAVIGDQVKSGAQAGIAGSIRKGHVTVQGSPAIEAKNFARSSIVFKNLPEMYSDVNRMKKEIEELKEILNKNK